LIVDGLFPARFEVHRAESFNFFFEDADEIVANGVSIDESAQFSLTDLSSSSLPIGTVVTVLSNTSATPITGTFGNLADGAVFSVGSNNYQANYEGGDGNDLTLTVVP
jgi:hypothetical protein